jgi:hypothetical protein
MTPSGAATTPARHPAVRLHGSLCLGALVILLFGLVQQGAGIWSLFPVFIGSLGLAAGWRSAPFLLLLSLGAALLTGAIHSTSFGFGELILCAAALAFVSANYRLQSLVDGIFPADARLVIQKKGARPRKELRAPVQPPPRRTADWVSNREILWLLAPLPVWAGLAQGAWLWLQARESPLLGVPAQSWQIIVLVWFMGLPTVVLSAFLSYRGWTRWTVEEATLFLQDQAWLETRKEQSRIGTWLAWAHKRRRDVA